MTSCIQELSAEVVSLQEYLKGRKPGEFLKYGIIERDTGIKMDTKGKSHLRRAAKREQLEYGCHYGDGIELASPENGVVLVRGKIVKINRAIKRGGKTQDSIQDKFIEDMSREDQKWLRFTHAVFGALRGAAENGRALFKKKLKDPPLHITYPIIDHD